MEEQKATTFNIARARGGAVRVVMPAEVAFNLDKFQASIKNLAERLGCRPCLSGANCTFVLERDFIIDPATLDVRLPQDPVPL